MVLTLAFFHASAAQAASRGGEDDYIFQIAVKKPETKKQNRWSLSDWLDTRDRMRVQDLWLAMHSPSPYEAYLGGDIQFNFLPGLASTTYGWRVQMAAYATIFGLEGVREQWGTAALPNDVRWSAWFNFRFFGLHHQATNLTAHIGVRHTENNGDAFRNILVGGEFSLYLAKFFGVRGQYHYLFGSTPYAGGVSSTAHAVEGGAYLDFSFLRVYGDYFWEPLNRPTSSSIYSGIRAGLRIYI